MTDDPRAALDFVESCGGAVIVKGVSSMKTWATRYCLDDRDRLRWVRNCPVLLQEEIRGPDVRVHVLGDELFAEEIEGEGIACRRPAGTNRFRQVGVPAGVADRFRAVADLLRVPFVGIDLKQERSRGEWLLLEANTMPGYEGYDRRTGGAIARELTRWLRRRA